MKYKLTDRQIHGTTKVAVAVYAHLCNNNKYSKNYDRSNNRFCLIIIYSNFYLSTLRCGIDMFIHSNQTFISLPKSLQKIAVLYHR